MGKIIVCGDFLSRDVSQICFSAEIKELFQKADSCICNFEGPVKVEHVPSPKSGPSLCQDPEAPHFLMNEGFNVFLLANNHIMDYGSEGCKATMDAFKSAVYAGVGTAHEAYRVKKIQVGDKTFGIISLTQHEFGVVESRDEKPSVYGAAWACSLDVEDIIKEAKREVDYLLVFPHAGVEHTDAPLLGWRRLYRRFISWGADMVIASHPHCPQGWELYQGKYIFYSLGNFYWDCVKPYNNWTKSIAVEICIDEELSVKAHNVIFDDKHQVAIDHNHDSDKHVEYLNMLLSDEKEYVEYMKKMCASRYESMRYGILRGMCGISIRMKLYWVFRLTALMLMGNKDEAYLLNAVQNESHRWVLQHYLNNKIKN